MESGALIELHAHILPQMDDGSESVEMSLAMLQALAGMGVGDGLCDLPLLRPGEQHHHVSGAAAAALNALHSAIPAGSSLPRILPAAEAAYFRGMEEHHPERLCIENTRTLMLEMPFSEWTDQQVETVAVLSLDLHFNVVLVHPERFCFSSSNRRRLEELAKLPLALQVNADTLLRWGTRRQGLELLELTATPLLGSDCHDMTKRPPNLKGGREMVRRKLGEAFLAQMDENARRLTAPTLAQV